LNDIQFLVADWFPVPAPEPPDGWRFFGLQGVSEYFLALIGDECQQILKIKCFQWLTAK